MVSGFGIRTVHCRPLSFCQWEGLRGRVREPEPEQERGRLGGEGKADGTTYSGRGGKF